MTGKQLANEVYGPSTTGGPITKINSHNDRLARKRGITPKNVGRIASEYAGPIEPYFTVLTSPPYATSELVDLPIGGECE